MYGSWKKSFMLGNVFLLIVGIMLLSDYSVTVDWEIVEVNSVMIVMTLLFDWMSFLYHLYS